MNQNGKPKLAVLYGRRSPQRDAAEDTGPQRQIEDLRTWCAANGYEIAGEFTDEALSGGDDWDERPGMLDAASTCKRGMTFLVRSYDRLFRDARKALTFCAMLEAKGVNVVSITEPAANGDDPIADMIRTIMLAIAEYQRALIRARTKARMLQHQAGGRRMSARTPWGTRVDPADPTRLVENLEEIATARMIVGWHDAGNSFRKISRSLKEVGMLRRGKPSWSHVLVRRIYERFKESTK